MCSPFRFGGKLRVYFSRHGFVYTFVRYRRHRSKQVKQHNCPPPPPPPYSFPPLQQTHTASRNRRDTFLGGLRDPISLRQLGAHRLAALDVSKIPRQTRKRSSKSNSGQMRLSGMPQRRTPIQITNNPHPICRRIWLIVQPEPPSVVLT